jgi:glycine/serine hydroxymethyltransferase
MLEDDFRKIAQAVNTVLNNIEDDAAIQIAKETALELCAAHPLPY